MNEWMIFSAAPVAKFPVVASTGPGMRLRGAMGSARMRMRVVLWTCAQASARLQTAICDAHFGPSATLDMQA